MDNTATLTPPPTYNPPISNPFFSTKTKVILGIVAMISLVVSVLLLLPQPKPGGVPVELRVPTTMSGLEIAKKTALFLDKSIAQEGVFYLTYDCFKDKKDCYVSPTGGPSGQAIVAYKELFRKTGNAQYRQKADSLVEAYLKLCQNNNLCATNNTAFLDYFRETGDNKYKEAILKMAPTITNPHSLNDSFINADGRKLKVLFEATGDQKYLDQAKILGSRFLNGEFNNDPSNPILYTEKDFVVRKQDLRLIGYMYLPIYQITGDPKYLAAIQNFFNKANLTNHLDQYKPGGELDLILTMDTLLALGDKAQAEKIAQVFIKELWDNPNNIKFNGDFGFVQNFSNQNNYKSTVNNGWLILLFLQMSDRTFNLK